MLCQPSYPTYNTIDVSHDRGVSHTAIVMVTELSCSVQGKRWGWSNSCASIVLSVRNQLRLEKQLNFDSIFCEVQAKNLNTRLLDPEYEGITIIRDTACHLSVNKA